MTATPDTSAPNTLDWYDAGSEGERLVSLRILSQPARLRLVRSVISEAAEVCGCSDACVRDIVLAVDEACQNIIRHAYEGDPSKEIYLDVWHTGSNMVFYLLDFAAPVDVTQIKPRNLDELKPGGLGIHFINECMDFVEHSPLPQGVGNLLRMKKKIA